MEDYSKEKVVQMATSSFTTNQKFSKKSAAKLLYALEKSDDKQKDVFAPPNRVKYIKRTDTTSFENFLKKTLDK